MKKVCVAAAIAASVGSLPAHAEAYRLAYSKAENIEIFIDHANGSAWCGPHLDLRAVYGAAPDADALGRLLPKIGVLLSKQCPQAVDLRWTSVSNTGARIAEGTSTKAAGWPMQTATAAAPAPAAIAAAPVAAAPAAVAPAAVAPAAVAPVAVAPVAAAPAAAEPPASAAAPAELAPVTSAQPAAEQAAAPAQVQAAPAPAAIATPAPVPVAEPAAPPPVAATPQAPAAEAAIAVAPAPVAAPAPAAAAPAAQPVFAVNGWTPSSAAAAMAGSQQLKVMQDQNGCKVISTFRLGEGAQYITLKTDGLSCGPDGYATGKGRLRLERTDGARIAQSNDVWLASGIPFTNPVAAANLAYVNEANGTLWFHMASDPASRSHYLMRAERMSYGSGLDVWRYNRIDVVTENVDAFRNAADIKVAVDATLRVLERTAMPDAGNARMVFSDNFELGAIGDKLEHMLYAINADRTTDWRTGKPKGEWRYNLQYAQNYVFKRDEMLARQKREAQMRLANKERDNLRQYQNLVEQAKSDPAGILGRMQHDVRYDPLTGGSYGGLMAGRKSAVRMVVHVDDHKDDDAVADWPYELRLPGQKGMKEGWYLVPGDITLDPKRQDGKGLPLTLLTLGQAAPYACQKAGCADLNDPLVGARMMMGLSDWTPEKAQAVIDQANQP